MSIRHKWVKMRLFSNPVELEVRYLARSFFPNTYIHTYIHTYMHACMHAYNEFCKINAVNNVNICRCAMESGGEEARTRKKEKRREKKRRKKKNMYVSSYTRSLQNFIRFISKSLQIISIISKPGVPSGAILLKRGVPSGALLFAHRKFTEK